MKTATIAPSTRRIWNAWSRSQPADHGELLVVGGDRHGAGVLCLECHAASPIAPVMAADQLLHRGGRRLVRRHPAAQAQHLHPVRDLHDVRHRVADQHHRHPLVADPADGVEDVRRLPDAEGRGRLVEEHDPVRPVHGARDGDGLALAARHRTHGGGEAADGGPEVLEGRPGLGPHRAGVHEAQPPGQAVAHRLPAEEHVLDRVEVRRQGQVLVHGLDAELAGLGGRVDDAWAAVEEHLARVDSEVARQRLDQRRLARAVVADQGDDLTGVDVEVGSVEGRDVAELTGQPTSLEDGSWS